MKLTTDCKVKIINWGKNYLISKLKAENMNEISWICSGMEKIAIPNFGKFPGRVTLRLLNNHAFVESIIWCHCMGFTADSCARMFLYL